MNTLLCKSLQNIDRNITGRFGVCKCYWSGNVGLRIGEKKLILRKRSLKIAVRRYLNPPVLWMTACTSTHSVKVTLLRASDNYCHLLCERFFHCSFAILRFKFPAKAKPGSVLAHHVTHLNKWRCQKLTPANENSFFGLRPLLYFHDWLLIQRKWPYLDLFLWFTMLRSWLLEEYFGCFEVGLVRYLPELGVFLKLDVWRSRQVYQHRSKATQWTGGAVKCILATPKKDKKMSLSVRYT